LKYSKKGERKISTFVGQELLFDFITNNLDPEREASVQEFLKSSEEARADVQKIKLGMDYTEGLSQIQVSDLVYETIRTPSSYSQVVLRKLRFDEWSRGVKMGLEVMVVAVAIIAITLVIPWHKVMDINASTKKQIVLAEVDKGSMANKDVEVAGSPEEATVVFPDEGTDKNKKIVAAPTVLAPVAKPAPEKNVKEVVVAKTVVVNETPADKKSASVQKNEDNNVEKRQGFLYRGVIRVTNVAAVTPKFIEKINELGGRKAGEVDLGWKKGASTYFHLTIPEAKYKNLLDFAKDYGDLKIQKEKHERVMAEGLMRIIFTIEEKNK